MRYEVSVGLLVLTALLILGDIFLALDDVTGNTYSEIIRDAGYQVTLLPWAVGGIVGHWFLPGERLNSTLAWIGVIALLAALELANLVLQFSRPDLSMLVGIGSGRLVWATPRKK